MEHWTILGNKRERAQKGMLATREAQPQGRTKGQRLAEGRNPRTEHKGRTVAKRRRRRSMEARRTRGDGPREPNRSQGERNQTQEEPGHKKNLDRRKSRGGRTQEEI